MRCKRTDRSFGAEAVRLFRRGYNLYSVYDALYCFVQDVYFELDIGDPCPEPLYAAQQRTSSGEWSVRELKAYISSLRRTLKAVPDPSPTHKSVMKHLEVAEKIRELQQGREAAGDV